MPEKFHEHRSLVGYSPWHHQELDMTERACPERAPLSSQGAKGHQMGSLDLRPHVVAAKLFLLLPPAAHQDRGDLLKTDLNKMYSLIT